MRDFITDNITAGAGAYMFKFGFRHLLAAVAENDDNIIKSVLEGIGIDTANKVIILHGCELTGSDYTSGAVYYDGEIYPVAASSIATTGLEVPYWAIDTVITSSLFTDNTTKGWLATRKMKLVPGTSVSVVNLQRYDLSSRYNEGVKQLSLTTSITKTWGSGGGSIGNASDVHDSYLRYKQISKGVIQIWANLFISVAPGAGRISIDTRGIMNLRYTPIRLTYPSNESDGGDGVFNYSIYVENGGESDDEFGLIFKHSRGSDFDLGFLAIQCSFQIEGTVI